MQSPEKTVKKHWSVHPWKLAAVVTVGLPIGITIGMTLAWMALMLQKLPILLALPALQNMMPSPDIGPATVLLWMLPFMSLMALAEVLAIIFVLRTQAKHGLAGQVQNRISRAALPGLLVAVALSLLDLLFPLTWDPSMTVMKRLPVLSMLLPAVYSTLLAATLLPVWRQVRNVVLPARARSAARAVPRAGQYFDQAHQPPLQRQRVPQTPA